MAFPESADDRVQRAAVRALGGLADPASEPHLRSLAQAIDISDGLLVDALTALGGFRKTESLPVIMNAMMVNPIGIMAAPASTSVGASPLSASETQNRFLKSSTIMAWWSCPIAPWPGL